MFICFTWTKGKNFWKFANVTFFYLFIQLYKSMVGSGSGEKFPDSDPVNSTVSSDNFHQIYWLPMSFVSSKSFPLFTRISSSNPIKALFYLIYTGLYQEFGNHSCNTLLSMGVTQKFWPIGKQKNSVPSRVADPDLFAGSWSGNFLPDPNLVM